MYSEHFLLGGNISCIH